MSMESSIINFEEIAASKHLGDEPADIEQMDVLLQRPNFERELVRAVWLPVAPFEFASEDIVVASVWKPNQLGTMF